ncbi:MAG: hypothetical protein V4633_09265 [Pseudomonadota bacterium]
MRLAWLVPLPVAHVSGFGVALSARGMNGSNNSAPNKLLVMIDGRAIYAPLFPGGGAWVRPGSNDIAGPRSARRDPSHTAQLRSTVNVADKQGFDVGLRKVGALANPALPGHTALDARYGWRIRPGMAVSLTVQNLSGGHGEYGALATRTGLDRSVALKLVWQR